MLIRLLATVGALSVSAILLAGCGSSSNSSHPSAHAVPPKATESIGDYARRFQAAADTGDCHRLQAVDPVFFAKSACAAVVPKVYRLKVLASASYGTGGVIDVTDAQSGPKGATFVVGVGPDNKWTIADGYGVGHRTVGTTAKSTSGFDASLKATIAALRSKNCPAFIKSALTPTNNPKECTRPFASQVAKALSESPTAAPTNLGGNADFQFYSVNLKGYSGHPAATYLTFPVTTTVAGPGVTSPYATIPPVRGTR